MNHETQISKPPKATRQHILTKLLILLTLRADLLCTLHYETPCTLPIYDPDLTDHIVNQP